MDIFLLLLDIIKYKLIGLRRRVVWYNRVPLKQSDYLILIKHFASVSRWWNNVFNNFLLILIQSLEAYCPLVLYNTGGCPFLLFRPSQILHPNCSAYISLNYGWILMFKVSKRPCWSSRHDKIICRWRHHPPGGENLN